MPKFTVEFRGTTGPGAGGHYTYTVTADTEQDAVEAAATKAANRLRVLNRGGTALDPTPAGIAKH